MTTNRLFSGNPEVRLHTRGFVTAVVDEEGEPLVQILNLLFFLDNLLKFIDDEVIETSLIEINDRQILMMA